MDEIEEIQQEEEDNCPDKINVEDLVNEEDTDVINVTDDDHCRTLERINKPFVIDLTGDDPQVQADVNGQHIKLEAAIKQEELTQELIDEEPINNNAHTKVGHEGPMPQRTRAPSGEIVSQWR